VYTPTAKQALKQNEKNERETKRMKLLRYGPPGHEKPGLLGPNGEIRDLSPHVEDIGGDVLSSEGLRKLQHIDITSLAVVEGHPRLGPPVGHVPNFIAIGLNYADHAKEASMEIPNEPVLFSKSTSCISGPNDDVVIPAGSRHSDWEAEIAFVIGTRTQHVSVQNALDHVAGYCVCNDVSQRNWQLETTGQWIKGKSYQTFGPIGPWLVTIDEIPDPQSLDIFLEVNGERMQSSNTSQMIFPIAELVSIVSNFMTLLPGDVVTTGTPPGVGLGMKPQRFLKPGDEMRLGVQGLGEQRQKVVEASS